MFEKYLKGPAPIPTEERFVFEVPSDTDPKKRYRVDLEANGGNGECACPDFRARRQPAVNDGAEILSEEALCKHVGRCWAYIFIACAKSVGEGSTT